MEYLIEDEMSTHYFWTIDEAYHIALKVEEKMNRRIQYKGRGSGKEETVGGSEKEEESMSG